MCAILALSDTVYLRCSRVFVIYICRVMQTWSVGVQFGGAHRRGQRPLGAGPDLCGEACGVRGKKGNS